MSQWSIETLLGVVELSRGNEEGVDMSMLLENSGSPVPGESQRKYPDGKDRMDIHGWFWGQSVNTVGGSADGSRNFAPLTVVRFADAASGTLASLAYSRTQKLMARISVHRSGGDAAAMDTGPMFEFQVDEAQITGQYFVSGGTKGMLMEVLVFSYRKMVVRTAAQQKSGVRGAVREAIMNATNVG